jgi:type I restriction enzyme R subunit
MYLDSPLKEHTLLQAIARVNRTADEQDLRPRRRLLGRLRRPQEALAIFAPSDVKGR